MKLLSKSVAGTKLKQDNDTLVETNIRLRKYEKAVTERLNNIRENYDPEKLQKLKEFEVFCKDITERKAVLLQELQAIQQEIEKKKDIYFGLIAKQDALDEKIYQMNEQESKLKLREAFVVDLENKWREKHL